MGPADDGPGRIEEAVAVLQERAGGFGRCPAGPVPDLLRFFAGEGVEGCRQGGGLYGEEGEMTTAAVTSVMTGEVRTEFRLDLPADSIYLFHEVPIVAEVLINS